MESGTDSDKTGAIAEQIIDNMSFPLLHVVEETPELVIGACLYRLCESPWSDALGFCDGMGMIEEAERAGFDLLTPANPGSEDEDEEDNEYEEYQEEAQE